MEPRKPAHRFLPEPPWTRRPLPSAPRPGLDLSDLSGTTPPPPGVRAAAANYDALAPAARDGGPLRLALAATHGVGPERVFPGTDLADVFGAVAQAALGADDIAALAEPCDPAVLHAVLVAGARYVDIGRDAAMELQPEALGRLLADEVPRLVVLARPAIPSGTVAPLDAVHAALADSAVVVVDESRLDWAGPAAPSALSLFDDAAVDTSGLVVVRRLEGLGSASVAYAIAETDVAALMWRVRPVCPLTPPVMAAALEALQLSVPIFAAVEEAAGRRDRLAAALRDAGFDVPDSKGPCLLVRRPGSDAADIRDAVAEHGIAVASSPQWSWREGVAISVPSEADVAKVIAAFSALGR